MAKRSKDTITVGTATAYLMVVEDTMPTKDDLFKEENRVGWSEGGAAVEYTEETSEIKDDLGRVSKVVTVSEEALVKLGLITWNGTTLQQLIDRCTVTDAEGVRTVKIGGAGNAQGKYYALGLHHVDKKDGDLWVIIKGRNTAGVTLTFATDEATKLEPEFKAMPHDEDGTLVEFIEETGTTV
jgi:hypothetical protein